MGVQVDVYVDVLLVINFIIDYLLLLFCGRLSGRRIRRRRLLLGALLGAASSLVIFLPPLGFWPLTGVKLAAACAMVRLAFPGRGWAAFLRDVFVFFTVSFLLAGICLGLWLGVGMGGVLCYNGVTYFDVNIVTLLLSVTAAYLLLGLYARVRGVPEGEGYTAVITYRGRSVTLSALRDSGNRLTEPFSGTPAAVAGLGRLQPRLDTGTAVAVLSGELPPEPGSGLRPIPCQTAAGGGMLLAFRPDRLELYGPEGGLLVEDIYIAISPEKVGTPEFDLLLPAAFSGIPYQKGEEVCQVG